MTVKVTATCEWCLQTVQTTLSEPVPLDWQTEEIADVESLGFKTREGSFCSPEHFSAYVNASPQCFEAAAADYIAKFYASMNVARKEETK